MIPKHPFRAFFAITLPKTIQHFFKQTVIDTLKKTATAENIRWTASEHLHMTLQFIHALQPDDVDILVERVKNAIQSIHPFECAWEGMSFFPPSHHPPVVALTLCPHPGLQELVHRIRHTVESMHYPTEKRSFIGHVTVGRLRHLPPALQAVWQTVSFPPMPPLPVREIVLFRSEPTETGSHYTPLTAMSVGSIYD